MEQELKELEKLSLRSGVKADSFTLSLLRTNSFSLLISFNFSNFFNSSNS